MSMTGLKSLVWALLIALVSTPLLAADPNEGRRVYNEQCAYCHGVDGNGELPGMPNFQRGERLMQADQSLFRAISDGRGSMPSFDGLLDEREILDVIAYLRTFMGQY
ncbi:cytochrome c [Marinobacter sp.]|uniref:c-type cytochrome n=1 Tax=Marinobacter sp. TaxID=50741 RepID=UPI002B461001|nr:cytochrome c [Marinobacter sp.]HKK55675.1 cytochrome c [Marinobacter sp.]